MLRNWAFLFGTLALLSCSRDDASDLRTSSYRPLLMTRASLESAFSILPPRPIKNTGKMIEFGQYVLLNEPFKGIHVIDMINPAQPQPIGFIQLPGNIDISLVAPAMLVADNAIDLVTIDLTNIHAPQLKDRKRAVFPNHLPPDIHRVAGAYSERNRPDDAIVVGWEKK